MCRGRGRRPGEGVGLTQTMPERHFESSVDRLRFVLFSHPYSFTSLLLLLPVQGLQGGLTNPEAGRRLPLANDKQEAGLIWNTGVRIPWLRRAKMVYWRDFDASVRGFFFKDCRRKQVTSIVPPSPWRRLSSFPWSLRRNFVISVRICLENVWTLQLGLVGSRDTFIEGC